MIGVRSVVAGATVVFTDRSGGVSTGRFASANVSTQVGDDPDAVLENRRRALAALLGPDGCASPSAAERLVWVGADQRHGNEVAVIDAAAAARHRNGLGHDELPAVDVLVTTCTDAVLVMLGADCAPIALVGDGAVAAVHVGWRGLTIGAVGAAVAALRSSSPGSVRALVGPTVGPCCYEFAVADLERVSERLGPHVWASTTAGTPALDLPAGIRTELARAGVEDVVELGVCTACSPRYFSYRREPTTGRQAVLVCIDPRSVS